MNNSNKFQELDLVDSIEKERTLLEDYIRHKKRDDRPLNILEAGCGNSWILNLSGIEYTLTGLDVNKDALENRKNQVCDLDEIIAGDLRVINLEANKYDVIYNSFVLEHIKGAEIVMDKFYRCLKKGGILILKIPDRDSVFGFITRMTPYRIHYYYKRYLRGDKNAGKPGYGPFPTYYDNIVSRKGLHEFCDKKGLIIRAEYGLNLFMKKHGIFNVPISLFVKIISLASFGRLEYKHNILTYIIEKQ